MSDRKGIDPCIIRLNNSPLKLDKTFTQIPVDFKGTPLPKKGQNGLDG